MKLIKFYFYCILILLCISAYFLRVQLVEYMKENVKQWLDVQPEIIEVENTKEVYHVKNYSHEEILGLIEQYARINKVRPLLVRCIAKSESNFGQFRSRYESHIYTKIKQGKIKFPKHWQQELIDDAGKMRGATSVGIMQLMPYTAASIAKDLNITINNMFELYDAELNVKLGTAYLAKCIRENIKKGWYGVAKCYNGDGDGVWKQAVQECVINAMLYTEE